jgi:hypothetical protein
MVDFVLVPNLGSGSELNIAIQNKGVELAQQMKFPELVSSHLYINQTNYPPLSPNALPRGRDHRDQGCWSQSRGRTTAAGHMDSSLA